MAEFESNECIDRIRARWELQATRYGARLSLCLTSSVAEIKNWNDIINNINRAAQTTTTTQVPNVGAAVLAETNDFVLRENLSRRINFRFRDLLFRFQPYLDRYEEFRASVIDNEEEIISELTQVIMNFDWVIFQNFISNSIIILQCDRALAAGFNNEARDDLELARRCASK